MVSSFKSYRPTLKHTSILVLYRFCTIQLKHKKVHTVGAQLGQHHGFISVPENILVLFHGSVLCSYVEKNDEEDGFYVAQS